MTPPSIALWMSLLAPRAPAARTEPLARAIAEVAEDRAEAAALVVLSFVETTFNRTGVPFGLSCCREAARTTEAAAARAAAIWRRSAEVCGRDPEARHGFFRLGRCVRDEEAQRRTRMMRRLLRHRAMR